MESKQLIDKLCNLAQLDIDAVHAYDEALQHIDNQNIYESIKEFRDDHIRHINDLSEVITSFGGTPPERTKDFKGYLIQGFTSLRSITGTIGALKAMETNEVLTNKTYANALESNEMPKEVRTLVEKNYEDEKRHLNYIRTTLKAEDK